GVGIHVDKLVLTEDVEVVGSFLIQIPPSLPNYYGCGELLQITEAWVIAGLCTSSTGLTEPWGCPPDRAIKAAVAVPGPVQTKVEQAIKCEVVGSKSTTPFICASTLYKRLAHPRAATPWFFTEIVRRRTKPLYRHPHIQKGSSMGGDELGSVTDGDDKHVPFDKSLLTDGAWRDLDMAPALQRGRKPATDTLEPPRPAPESPARSCIDLTLSSPPPDRTEATSEAENIS
ncbi:hypothetical protein CVT24_012365, partial [Panaeolus cyanescens]